MPQAQMIGLQISHCSHFHNTCAVQWLMWNTLHRFFQYLPSMYVFCMTQILMKVLRRELHTSCCRRYMDCI